MSRNYESRLATNVLLLKYLKKLFESRQNTLILKEHQLVQAHVANLKYFRSFEISATGWLVVNDKLKSIKKI